MRREDEKRVHSEPECEAPLEVTTNNAKRHIHMIHCRGALVHKLHIFCWILRYFPTQIWISHMIPKQMDEKHDVFILYMRKHMQMTLYSSALFRSHFVRIKWEEMSNDNGFILQNVGFHKYSNSDMNIGSEATVATAAVRERETCCLCIDILYSTIWTKLNILICSLMFLLFSTQKPFLLRAALRSCSWQHQQNAASCVQNKFYILSYQHHAVSSSLVCPHPNSQYK